MSFPEVDDCLDSLIEHIIKPLPDIGDDLKNEWEFYLDDDDLEIQSSSVVPNNPGNSIDTQSAGSSAVKNNSSTHLDSKDFLDLTVEEVLETSKCKCTPSHNEEQMFHRALNEHLDIQKKKRFSKRKSTKTKHSVHNSTFSHNEENILHRQHHHQDLKSQNKKHLSEKESTISTPNNNIENIFDRQHLESRNIKHLSANINDEAIKSEVSGNYKQYLKVYDYATSFVDDILREAEEKINVDPNSYYKENVMYSEDFEGLPPEISPCEIEMPASKPKELISILLIEDFTAKAGKKLISNIIENTWKIDKTWSYCINNIVENSSTCSDFYIYEVKWSLPSVYRPIPNVTASVFFTIEVSRVKSKDCPVIVTYNFETERYQFTTEDDIQQESFLTSILHCKLQFIKFSGVYYI